MHGRNISVTRRALVSSLLTVLLAAGEARAHRLDAQVFVLPNRQIQIESWFSNGDAAKGAKVRVFGPQEQLIAEGQLNEQGVFVFPSGDADQIKVVISAGAGHRKELSISARALTPAADATENENGSPVRAHDVSPAPVPLAERESGFPIKDVLIGVGFLMAAAAFILSLRNARKLRTIDKMTR